MGNAGTIITSSYGTSLDNRTSGTSAALRDVTYGNSTFMAVGEAGTILSSSDGTKWTSRTSGIVRNIKGVKYVNSTFVAVGTGGLILTSSNGTTWTLRTTNTTAYLLDVTYGRWISNITGILGNCVFATFPKDIKHLTFAGCQS